MSYINRETILRNADRAPISEQQMRKFLPAIYAKHAHEDVSERYGFISTQQTLDAMRGTGWEPVEARFYHRRHQQDLNYTKHMLRFRQRGSVAKIQVGDVIPEAVMVNSHDRSSRYDFYMGLFRLVCSNGMLVSEGGRVEPIVMRHTKSAAEQAADAVKSLIAKQSAVFLHINAMRKRVLDSAEQYAFAELARVQNSDIVGRSITIDPESLLNVRRPEDKGNDLWHVYQRVQENLTKGGVTGYTEAGRRVTTHGLVAMAPDMLLNRRLWGLAVAQLGDAAPAPIKEKEAA